MSKCYVKSMAFDALTINAISNFKFRTLYYQVKVFSSDVMSGLGCAHVAWVALRRHDESD